MKYLLYAFLFLVFGQSFGQFVEIPDDNFRTYLKGKYTSCFNSDNRMDTTCAEIVQERNLIIPNLEIFELEGVQYFDGLVGLYCYDNKITLLSKLPQSLNALVCSRNKISHLPNIPESVTYLACNSNLIKTLPKLPSKLSSLLCDSNQLYTLPTLPESLVNLTCNQNTLKKMPVLPANLSYLKANNNCFLEAPINPNPNVLTSFEVSPNREDCGIYTYLEKVTDDKYLVSYKKTTSTDYGVSLLEYRCGYGYGTAELANIAEFHKKFVDFDDYKVKNLKRGVISVDTVIYNETNYFNGDTIRIPKPDTVVISTDSRITGGYIRESIWTGLCHFYIKDRKPANVASGVLINSVRVPQKVIKYESRRVSEYLFFLPHKETHTITKPNVTKQLLADFKMYFKDTTFSFQYLDISCTNYLITDPGFSRRTVFSVPRVDSAILKIQEGKSNLKNIKLVYAIYNGNTSISDRNYIVCDSISSFGSSDVILRHFGSIDKSIWVEGDSIHYQVIAEFDTIQKPVIFQSNNIVFQTSIAKAVYQTNPDNSAGPLVFSDIIYNTVVLDKSLTICGNYKVKANIMGDSVNCLNSSKTYTSKVNLNDKSLAYVWKYTNASQSTSPNFNVSFPSTGTKSMELTLTSNCGTDKVTKNIQTISGPTKPSISQANNILTSSATTGNTWYKDGLLLSNETNKTLLITSSGKYKVTAQNSCGSATSNEISVILTENEDEFSFDAVQIYPNPVTSELFIEGLQKVYLAEIIDQFGTTIISKYVSDKNTINIAGLTSGMYFLRLFDENKTLKFMSKLFKN